MVFNASDLSVSSLFLSLEKQINLLQVKRPIKVVSNNNM